MTGCTYTRFGCLLLDSAVFCGAAKSEFQSAKCGINRVIAGGLKMLILS
jgi:hypothetical protein